MPTRSPGEPPSGEGSPAIPSFASLRDPRRRTAVDVLMAGPPPVPAPPVAEPVAGPPVGPSAVHAPAGPRPATYADLARFGMRVLRWAARVPARCLRQPAG